MRVALDSLTFRRRIGAGAGGFTYAAEYRGGQVAVKMASGGKEALVQWRNEALTLAKLSLALALTLTLTLTLSLTLSLTLILTRARLNRRPRMSRRASCRSSRPGSSARCR